MISPKSQYIIRRSHRFLGILIGIQFLAWTAGGLYFSWSDMDEVHGDYELSHEESLEIKQAIISPYPFIDSMNRLQPSDKMTHLKLVTILEVPCWQITYQINDTEEHEHVTYLYDAVSGKLREPVTESQAKEIARSRYLGSGDIESVEFLTTIGRHHEYREQPLPAFAISFNDDRRTTMYVSAASGMITKIRNRPWRQFDFLWMMHTMDYVSRDNITNWLLRIFSIFGITTVMSGVLLFFVSLRKAKA